MNTPSLVRSLLPPLLLSAAKRATGRSLRFRAAGGDWSAASRRSHGYADPEVIGRVAAATRAVVTGQAAFERDSVTFEQPDYRYPLLAGLMHHAALHRGNLHVIDLGGALGSTYWQLRPFLRGLRSVRWHVVEQPAFTEIGQREFAGDELQFAASLNEAALAATPCVALLSSVLQYLEHPDEVLAGLARSPATHLLIDRTPLHAGARDRLTIQEVPRHIYEASYPCWILSRPRLLEALATHWALLADFGCDEGFGRTDEGVSLEFRGFYLERR